MLFGQKSFDLSLSFISFKPFSFQLVVIDSNLENILLLDLSPIPKLARITFILFWGFIIWFDHKLLISSILCPLSIKNVYLHQYYLPIITSFSIFWTNCLHLKTLISFKFTWAKSVNVRNKFWAYGCYKILMFILYYT